MNHVPPHGATLPTLEALYEPIADDLEAVRNLIRETVREHHLPLDDIDGHIFQRWGKMLRPALVLFSGRAAGQVLNHDAELDRERLRTLATAIELLHNASLIHDDVLDRDDRRRSQPTLNALYGDRIAVLAGDVLFSKAFGILARSFEPAITTPITDVTAAMCNGEILIALNGKGDLSLDDYYGLIDMKTARLAGVSCYTGALLSGDTGLADTFYRFGREFGRAYQIVDDFIDGDWGRIPGLTRELATKHVDRAREQLRSLPDSADLSRLEQFLDVVLAEVEAGG